MTRTVYQSFARMGEGTPVASAAVEVRSAATGLYATIYDSESGGSTITQPGFVTGSDGKFVFYAEDGKYDITITSGSNSVEFNDIPIGNSQARDAGTDTDQLLTRGDADSLYTAYALNNTSATTDPSVGDDADSGYSVSSVWINTASDESFKCFDATAGAAVWKNTSLELTDLGSIAVVNTGAGASQVRLNSDNETKYANKDSDTLTNTSVNGITLSAAAGASNFLAGDGTYKAAGSGDVVGPASSTASAIAKYSDATGNNLADTGITIDASDVQKQPGASLFSYELGEQQQGTSPVYSVLRYNASANSDVIKGSANLGGSPFGIDSLSMKPSETNSGQYISGVMLEPVGAAPPAFKSVVNFSHTPGGMSACSINVDGFTPFNASDDGSGNGTITLSAEGTGIMDLSQSPPVIPSYTVASVPSAATYNNGIIIVSDETGGRTMATSDGTNWRRVYDGAVVS